MKIEIRGAKSKDVKEIISLNQKLFNYEYNNFDKTLDCSWPPKNENYFKKSVEDKNSIVLVAVSNRNIIGYLIGSIHKAEDYREIKEVVEVDNTFVVEEHRRKGIGKELFKKFLEWAKKKETRRMKVVASAKNKDAINFYKKCGFIDYNLTLERDI